MSPTARTFIGLALAARLLLKEDAERIMARASSNEVRKRFGL